MARWIEPAALPHSTADEGLPLSRTGNTRQPDSQAGAGTVPDDDRSLRIGQFILLPGRRHLLLKGARVRIGDRALDILLALADNPGAVLGTHELRQAVWPGSIIDDSALRVHLSALRKILSSADGDGPYVVNVAGRGYQLAAPVIRGSIETEEISQTAAALPGPVRMVGRDEIVLSLGAAASGRRLTTLVGPGGVGKTIVAKAAARARAAAYAEGCVTIDLSSIEAGGGVAPFLVSALGIEDDGGPAASVVRHFKHRRCLVVLDTCEHVVDAVAQLVEALLGGASQVDVLATSREPLQANGEWVIRLPPLAWPGGPNFPTAEAALLFPAVRLFVDRVTSGSSTFALQDAEVPALAEICAALDGIPLALEFAAARVGLLGVHELASRIGSFLPMLKRGHRTPIARHWTLRANLDWSFRLLSDDERALLRRLALFPAGFELRAAFAAAAGMLDEPATARCLASLAAKSLIALDLCEGSASYRLLETTKTYLADQA
jgi:predicted ATPase/DNA-binding winged helix-turn-helix (wHTH) protein